MPSRTSSRTPTLALVAGAAVGLLGGLIGLGGAEFRLPVLVRLFGYTLKLAVFLNLAISLITVVSALITRLAVGQPLVGGLDTVVALAVGSVLGAHRGASWLVGVSDAALHRAVQMLLFAIGLLLLAESVLTLTWVAPNMPPVVRLASALLAGIIIGIVSSLLGVAGGELIIPTLVFGYGVDVKIAGTLSLLVSLPTIVVGLWRHASLGNAPHARTDWTQLVAPMGTGSIIGAFVGGLLVVLVPGRAVKAPLGVVLIASAVRVSRVR